MSKILLDDDAIEKIERQAKKIKYRKIYPAYKVVRQLKVGLDKIDLIQVQNEMKVDLNIAKFF